MKRSLTKTVCAPLYHCVDGIGRIGGAHDRITGDVTWLRGDVSLLRGDVSGISGNVSCRLSGDVTELTGDVTGIGGDVTGLVGNVSGIYGDVSWLIGDVTGISGNATGIAGDVDACEITDAERASGVDISDLIDDAATEAADRPSSQGVGVTRGPAMNRSYTVETNEGGLGDHAWVARVRVEGNGISIRAHAYGRTEGAASEAMVGRLIDIATEAQRARERM